MGFGGVLAARRSIGSGLATSAGGGFVGAYDAVPSIVAAYGMRRLRTAYTGSILRIRRSSDSAEQDIGYTGSGDLDTAAVASFIGGGSGYIKNWYDQSGNAYTASQATAGAQPLYVASGQNGRPVGKYENGDSISTGLNLPAPFTILYIAAMTAIGQKKRILTASVNNWLLGWWENKRQAAYFEGWVSNPTIVTNYLYYLYGAVGTGSLSSVYENGIQFSSNSSGVAGPNGLGICNFGTETSDCTVAELVICNTALSTADRQAAEAAANNYWAIY